MVEDKIAVEVAYATPEEQLICTAIVAKGASVQQTIEASGILQHFPEIDLNRNKVGIFSKVCKLEQPVSEGDRVEIYRPLLIDPKEHRRQRAVKGKDIKVDSGD